MCKFQPAGPPRGGQEGQFASGRKGLIIEDFKHFDCRKWSECILGQRKWLDQKSFLLAFLMGGLVSQLCPWASRSSQWPCPPAYKNLNIITVNCLMNFFIFSQNITEHTCKPKGLSLCKTSRHGLKRNK